MTSRSRQLLACALLLIVATTMLMALNYAKLASSFEGRLRDRQSIVVRNLGQGFFQVSARFGFMETPNVPALLEACAIFDLPIDPETVTFYLGRETLLSSEKKGMMRWRKGLFAFISRNARPATLYFGIPPNRVVELGMQVEL